MTTGPTDLPATSPFHELTNGVQHIGDRPGIGSQLSARLVLVVRNVILGAIAIAMAGCVNASDATPPTSSTLIESEISTTTTPTVSTSTMLPPPAGSLPESEAIVLPDTADCGLDFQTDAGFSEDAVRIGVRSVYEDWSQGNEMFTAFLEHVARVGGRRLEVVDVSVGSPVPSDLALLADFTFPSDPYPSSQVPPCMPFISRRYTLDETSPWHLAMPALTSPVEARLWAKHVARTLPPEATVGALVIDHDFGDHLLESFTEAVPPGTQMVVARHERTTNEVAPEVEELLAANPDVLLIMTAGEPCRKAVTAIAERPAEDRPISYLPSVCVGFAYSANLEQELAGWLAFQQPQLVRSRLDPELREAIESAGWYPETGGFREASITAAWWVVDALRRGVSEGIPLMEALLTTTEGPPWFPGDVTFETGGLADPLAVEGAALAEWSAEEGGWVVFEHVDLETD